MKKRLNQRFVIIAATAIVVTTVCAMFLFFHFLTEQIYDDLRANAHVIETFEPEQLEQKLNYDLSEDGLRITIVASDGSVVYDSAQDAATMENHAKRPEIKEALQNGEGTSMRRSKTSSVHTFYYATKMDNGEVLRIGKESGSIYRYLTSLLILIVIISILILLVCIWFSHILTRRLVEPIEKLADNLVMVDDSAVYEEMRPFISTIKKQHMDILNHARMRQEFTANVSHELKTPLTAISGYAELIESGMTNEEDTRHFAGEIHQSAERLQVLINDTIKLSELDDSNLELELEPIDLYECAKKCLESLKIPASKNEVELIQEGTSVPMSANKTLIDELLYNLCSNAIRYNKKGGKVTVTTAVEDGRPMLLVADTGIGIPKEHQSRVFERFYRVDKSRSKSTGGTGLGLAIVKHIVAQHGAQISLTSEEGVGTEVKVVF